MANLQEKRMRSQFEWIKFDQTSGIYELLKYKDGSRNKYALTQRQESGALNQITAFLLPVEMENYLKGLSDAINKRVNILL